MENLRVTQRLQEEIEKLLVTSDNYIQSSAPGHEIEKGLFKELLNLGNSLLRFTFESRIALHWIKWSDNAVYLAWLK